MTAVVSIYEDPGRRFPFSVIGDLRTPGSGMAEDNYSYEDEVKRLLEERILLGNPMKTVQFNSEHSCFFAYCQTREDAETIAHFATKVAGQEPSSPPSIQLPGDVGKWVAVDDYQDSVPVGSVGVIIAQFRDPELHEDDEDRGEPGYEDDRPDVWEVFVPAVQPDPRLTRNSRGGETVRVPAGSQVILEVTRNGD